MVLLNLTYINEGITNYSIPIWTIIGAIIAGLVGFIITIYKDHIDTSKRQKLVATALYEEITTFYDFFNILLENYTLAEFQEYFIDIDRTHRLENFCIGLFNRIIEYGISTSGRNSSLISEISPFSVFYEDIFKFHDLNLVRSLNEYYRYLLVADRCFKNYCDIQNRIPLDLLHFLEAIEKANGIVSNEGILDSLYKIKKNRKII